MNNNFTLFVDAVNDPTSPAIALRIVDSDGKDLVLVIPREQAEALVGMITGAIAKIPTLAGYGDESTWKFDDCAGCATMIGYPHPGPCLNAERAAEKIRRNIEAAAKERGAGASTADPRLGDVRPALRLAEKP